MFAGFLLLLVVFSFIFLGREYLFNQRIYRRLVPGSKRGKQGVVRGTSRRKGAMEIGITRRHLGGLFIEVRELWLLCRVG